MERRLRALARQRRRQAEDLPGMSGIARDRLRAEVGRRREQAEVGLTEAVPDGPQPRPEWSRGRVWLPWVGVAAAATAMVWMVWFPDPRRGGGGGGSAPGALAHHSWAVPAVEEWSAPGARGTEEGPAAEAWGPTTRVSAAPAAARAPVAAPAGVQAAMGLALSGRPRGEGDSAPTVWAGGVRWRQTYQVTSEGEVPAFLGIFECVRSGDQLEVRAADGTVFRGRVTMLPARAGHREGWVYEAQGQPLGWPSEVSISLQWDRPEAGGEGDGEGGYLAEPLRGTLLWGRTNVVEWRAEPSGDG